MNGVAVREPTTGNYAIDSRELPQSVPRRVSLMLISGGASLQFVLFDEILPF